MPLAATVRTPRSEPRHLSVMSDGVRLAVTSRGDVRLPTVVLVHGYPDSSEVWNGVVDDLVKDFHVVTYDVRGAGHSDRPARTADYRLPQLCRDFTAVIDRVSPKKPVHLVAHDWGSIQSWESVTEPALKGRIASYTTISGPCLDHMGHWFRDQFRQPSFKGLAQVGLQSLKSWYVYFFHLPVLPIALWGAGVGKAWPRIVRLLEGVDTPASPTQTRDGQFGVRLYRANIFQRLFSPRERHAHAPVQVLVPRRDLYVSPWLSENLERWAPGVVRHEFDATHWMPVSHAAVVARHVREFTAGKG